jgi:hypothetical protein
MTPVTPILQQRWRGQKRSHPKRAVTGVTAAVVQAISEGWSPKGDASDADDIGS